MPRSERLILPLAFLVFLCRLPSCDAIFYSDCRMKASRLIQQASIAFRRQKTLPILFAAARGGHQTPHRLYSSPNTFSSSGTDKPVREPPPGADMGPDPSKYTPYERWVRRLYQTNLFNPVKLGLHNIEQLHGALGSPMNNVSFWLCW